MYVKKIMNKAFTGVMMGIMIASAAPAFSAPLPSPEIAVNNPIPDLVVKAGRSVVNIDVEGTVTQTVNRGLPNDPFFREFFGDSFREFKRQVPMKGTGSGFIVSSDGKILTNNHVISGADKITVTFADGTTKEATVIGKDPTFDIAVIKVDGKDLPALELGDSDAVRVGDWTVAIGNTLGLGLEPTVTVGVLSARNRSIHSPSFSFDGFLQTDAAINPGNSGGPLLDIKGRVIGINTAIIPFAQGIGFAIPINMAKQVMDDIIAYGQVRRGQIGVYLQPITKEIANAFGMKDTKGALVAEIMPDSPAEKAGLKRGDIITALNGKKIDSSVALSTRVRQHMAGDKIKLEVVRLGKTLQFEVTLAEVDASVADSSAVEKLGFSVSKLTPELRKELKIPEREDGLAVTSVTEKSVAARAGLKKGDLLLQANGRDLRTPEDLSKAISASKRNVMALLVLRNGRTLFLPIEVK
ncbi:MAG: DegQ family serine endoprotease [Pyramidobacter sp.]|nr:DegQ family serine endoprotease [Pyramidobacter sp.]